MIPFSGHFEGDGPSPLNRDTTVYAYYIAFLLGSLKFITLTTHTYIHYVFDSFFLLNSRTTPSAMIAQAVTGSNCVADYLEVSLKMDY